MCWSCCMLLQRYGCNRNAIKKSNIALGIHFHCYKSSLRITKWFAISLVCFPKEEKRRSALFPGRRLLFKNVRGVALLAAVLAAIPATALHFDVPRQLIGRDLWLSGIARLYLHSFFYQNINLFLSAHHSCPPSDNLAGFFHFHTSLTVSLMLALLVNYFFLHWMTNKWTGEK